MGNDIGGKKKIVIKGYAGLGNRLRTIAAGIEYAQKTNRDIIIDWSDGMFAQEGVNAFDRYFLIKNCDIKENILLDNETSYYPKSFSTNMKGEIGKFYTRKEIKNFIFRKIVNLILIILYKFSAFEFIENRIYYICMKYKYFELKKEYVEKLGYEDKFVFGGQLKKGMNEEVVLFVDNVPAYKTKNLLENISLQPDVETDLNTFVEKYNLKTNSIGIHIRATDKHYIGNIKRLIISLRRFMKKKSINKIFLSTDNKKIEEVFIKEFGSQIIAWPKFIPEQGKQGIHNWAKNNNDEYLKERMTREAILDMFTLAQTEYLLYQFGSTFSEISKVYHKDHSKCLNWLLFEYIMPFI